MDVHAVVTKGWAVSRAILTALLAVGLALGACRPADAQSVPAPVLITAPIDEARTVTLEGNTRPEANASNDRGRVPDSLPLPHLQLLLKRPAQRESALQRYIAQLHDRRSPNFHRWVGAAEFAQSFGLSQPDLAAVIRWLGQQGFVVNTVYPGDTVIDFSGTAGAVRSAFHTEIHSLVVAGVRHIANMTDPQIPAALAPAVTGIVSLHDFRPHAMNRPRAKYTTSSGSTLVAPADLATIYNLNPLFSRGLTGQSQTIVVIEDTDVFDAADWTTFRNTFGLSSYTSGSFTQVHPAPAGGSNNCTDPGVLSGLSSFEAILDAEWASAAAPAAAIELASCANTTTFGGLIALQNLVSQPTPPAIVSISYGECEAENGAAANAAFSSVYEQAVTEGVSVFVAAGDEGAASCDPNAQFASHGIGVSGFASTAYNVAVGGTDFGDTYTGTTATYWSATNSATFGSALSYVPEIPWNDSCAGSLVDSFEGFSAAYSTSSTPGFCNSTTGSSFLTTSAGSGGPSACASGAPRTEGVVGGSCTGTPKPSWQSGVPGVPSDAVRDLPDVSMFASNGFWGHYYVVCWSDTAAGGADCTGAPSGWAGGGGTSFASPILAGIQALVNQSTGTRAGNPNYVYYTLAASQSASGLACNSSSGNAVAGGCVFHDVTQGDMDINCRGSIDCFLPTGTNGALSTGSGAFSTAYGAAAGWDFATGIGSINAYNLVQYWTSSDLALSGHGSVTAGGQLQYALTIRDAGPQGAAAVVVIATLPPGLTLVQGSSSAGCTQSGSMVSCSVGTLASGSTASLNLVLQPTGAAQTINLTFTAGSANADLNPGDGVDSISLNWPGQTDVPTAVPVPPWATVFLGLLLLAIIRRRELRNAALAP
jgi:uncharacterized repeat protein (TIGR01451 family)